MNYKLKQYIRNDQKEQGFFDGRFVPKSIPNKKKQLNKKLCRTKVKYG